MESAPPLRVAFAGAFAARLEAPVRSHLDVPCDVIVDDERGIVSRLADVDVLVTMAFTPEMAAACRRLKLVQVPGAGLDRIERAAVPAGTHLANAYGHDVGIAEYVIGAMLALTRSFSRLDASLRRGVWESQWNPTMPPPPMWPELAGKTLGILGYGRIGQALARRARAFDMVLCAIRQHPAGSDRDGLAFLGGPDALDEILRPGRLSGDHALTHRGHSRTPRCARAGHAEAERDADQRGARRHRRRGGALSSAGRGHDRGRRARRVVSVSDRSGPHAAPAAIRFTSCRTSS